MERGHFFDFLNLTKSIEQTGFTIQKFFNLKKMHQIY